jgi:putative PIN family toxin of toxin-antitoxin system
VRVALDLSVLITAYISRAGVCAELLKDVMLHHELVTSEFIVGEVTGKLTEKFLFPRADTTAIAASIRRSSSVVEPAKLASAECRDPDDILVLGTAVAGKCQLLVSVDRDLLDMKSFQGIAIVRPGDFWRRVGQ